jgi:hypothetical protein
MLIMTSLKLEELHKFTMAFWVMNENISIISDNCMQNPIFDLDKLQKTHNQKKPCDIQL